MMELVDMRDLGSRVARRWGSSPHTRTKIPVAAMCRCRDFNVGDEKFIPPIVIGTDPYAACPLVISWASMEMNCEAVGLRSRFCRAICCRYSG